MPRAATEKGKDRGRRVAVRLLLWGVLFCFLLSGALWGAQQLEQFLITDPRFILAAPTDYGQESPGIRIDGVTFASRAQILRVFANDLGRSIYLLPLAERRRTLLRVSWVKDAGIVRLWPNHVVVHITERRPAAFLGIDSECITRWSLIDSDGVILEPPQRPHQFDLPLLRGVPSGERAAARGMRVRRMQALLRDLGGLSANVSEIDVSDMDDLRITEKMQEHAVKLMLGDHNFHERLQNFLDHYSDIHRRLPDAHAFDLRLDDRITVVQEPKNVCG
jgi:cell division protein FtsQ